MLKASLPRRDRHPSGADYIAATRKLKKARTICVVGHKNPDADAIGSICALLGAIEQLGNKGIGVIGQREPIDPGLLGIPRAQGIRCVEKMPDCDLIVVVDCGGLGRTGTLQPEVIADPSKVILVDHHASNRGFAGINLLDYQAESTTTVLHEWFRYLGVDIDDRMAHALYAGLATDTGGFRWGRPQMHEFAQELVAHDLDIRRISSELFDGGSVADLKMLGNVLADLRLLTAGKWRVLIAMANHDRIEGHPVGAVEKIAETVRGMSEADLVVVPKEYQPGDWAVSLRSDALDVSMLARTLGGGGHVRSAGYSTFGTEDHVIAEVLAAIAHVE
ncbi:DHH family phosphoesterase [Corynebacterium gerontici]|nr:DHH family phosphoesterase [Corynebacterium gerontici]